MTGKPRGEDLEREAGTFVDKVNDIPFAAAGPGRAEFAELLDNLALLEMNADYLVVVTAVLYCAPLDDVIGGGPLRIAQIGLLISFLVASPGLAVEEELIGSELCFLNAIDDFEQAEFDGIRHGDAIVQIPGGAWSVGA